MAVRFRGVSVALGVVVLGAGTFLAGMYVESRSGYLAPNKLGAAHSDARPPSQRSAPSVPSSSSTAAPQSVVTVTLGTWTGVKPRIIYFSGDAGNIFRATSWSGWGTSQATANGTVDIQGCVPNCASGTETPTPATVILGGIGEFGTTGGGIRRQYTTITEVDSYLPLGGGSTVPTSQIPGASA